MRRALLQRLSRRRLGLLQSGFTLMELLTVVVIVGVLAAIATPTFLNQQGRARVISANSTAQQAALSCAALQVTQQQGLWVRDPNIAAATCPAAGTAVTFTTNFGTGNGITTEAQAVVNADGSTQLTRCASGSGATNTGTAPQCQY